LFADAVRNTDERSYELVFAAVEQSSGSRLEWKFAEPASRPGGIFEGTDVMINPSKADCIAILCAAQRAAQQGTLLKLDPELDPEHLGLTRNGMETAAAFLMERDCFTRRTDSNGHVAVSGLSLQGRLRLDQLANG
jgi:hypothetical protein